MQQAGYDQAHDESVRGRATQNGRLGAAFPNLALSTLTRRQMLGGIAGGIGLLAASGALPLLHTFTGRAAAIPELTQNAFTRVVGSWFKVDAQGRIANAQLLAVLPLAVRTGPKPTGEGFSLLFSGSLDEKFGQGTYTVDHPILGRNSMFLVPVGPPGPDQRYEAVFNRLWK